MLWNYAYLNPGLTINYNGNKFHSEKGLYDLLENKISGEILYPILHIKGEDIEVAMTHGSSYGEEYYSFVNGQHTTQGGTHQGAFREALVKTVREFYKKDYEAVWGLPYKDLLEKLAQAEGFVYLPQGGDTCPRMTIEARLLDCELILNTKGTPSSTIN